MEKLISESPGEILVTDPCLPKGEMMLCSICSPNTNISKIKWVAIMFLALWNPTLNKYFYSDLQ